MSTLRIASLVPAATEIVCALGLESNLVAVSHSCDYPPLVKSLPIVTTPTALPAPEIMTDEDGETYELPPSALEIDAAVRAAVESGEGLYRIDTEKLRELKPDLVLTQGLSDLDAASYIATARAVKALGDSVKVLDLSPTNMVGVLKAFRDLGLATDREAEADELIEDTRSRWEAVQMQTALAPARPRTLLLGWPEPLFSAGFWSPELLSLANATLAPWDTPGAPSRILSWEEIRAFAPEVILLAACGFDAERSAWESTTLSDLPGWFDLPAVRNGDCYAIDGNAYVTRFSPRLADTAELLATILHPEAMQNTVPPYSVMRFPNEAMNPD